MKSASPILKKPKVEHNNGEDNYERAPGISLAEQEEALVALLDHRSQEVEHLKKRVSYYTSQLKEAEDRLLDAQRKLKYLREQKIAPQSKASVRNGSKTVKLERRSLSPSSEDESASRHRAQSKSELVIPAANPKTSQLIKVEEASKKASPVSGAHLLPSTFPIMKLERERPSTSYHDVEVADIKDKGTKRKLEQKEHKELSQVVRTCSSPCKINCYASNHISSQHKRKLRSLVVCPVNDQLFATSALDGMVNLWQIQGKGSSASLLSSSDCFTSKRRWPEDIAWHPQGNGLFSAYSADGGDSQISILNLNKTHGKSRVTYLEDRPHVKGIINSISFMPWENTCFATGGSDHAVVLWNEKSNENEWKPKKLHKELHTSAVMGVAGLQHKNIVISAGADKRIIGFDVQMGRTEFRNQLDSKCMSVLPNPCDFNLFMVQTGTPGKQVRLFDMRVRQTEVHVLGFKQESSDSQSALINQSWSPDGLYVTSGSVDPVIHIFDIRYNSREPSQSVRAHNKRVFKAVWHYCLPLLISISSDLHIGLHKIS